MSASEASRISRSLKPRTSDLRLRRPEAFLPLDLAELSLYHPLESRLGTGPYEPAGDRHGKRDLKNRSARRSVHGLLSRQTQYRCGRNEPLQGTSDSMGGTMRGGIDAVHEVTPTSLDFVEAQTTVKTFPFSRPYYIQLLFNCATPRCRQAVVRLALSQGVDRQALVDVALNGRGVPAEGPSGRSIGHTALRPRHSLQSGRPPRSRLDAAGYKVVKRPGAMPSRFASRA